MGALQEVKTRLRTTLEPRSPELQLLRLMLRPKVERSAAVVTSEYEGSWSTYQPHLDRARHLDDWLKIPGVDDQPGCCVVDGDRRFGAFDSVTYYREALAEAIAEHFPQARSVTEYGCGVGRNLLFLKQRFPELEAYGYELCRHGVSIAQQASAKFKQPVQYRQLDYVLGSRDDFAFPTTDLAFTLFSLEQIPTQSRRALENIRARVTRGSLHLEPVVENYPLSYRGLLGRLYHHRVDYLRHFERHAKSLEYARVEHRVLPSSHSPFLVPSLYVLKV